MHDIDRGLFEMTGEQYGEGETYGQTGTYGEAGTYGESFGEVFGEEETYATAGDREALETFGESEVIGEGTIQEIALASELLEVTTEEELDRFLGNVLRSGVSAGAKVLEVLRLLVEPATAPTVPNAVAILKPLAAFWGIPWQLPFTILQHEGGVKLFRHHDGVMQTIAAARKTVLPKLPRPLKLVLLGLPATDPTPDGVLTEALHREFPRRLSVQIAAGTQELVSNLQRFNGYVALAFVGYNAGAGSAHWVATGRSATSKPRLTGDDWERACLVGATLLHQPPAAVNVPQGVWQCDANLAVAGKPGTGWHRKFAVRDKRTNRLLIAYQYLRSVKSCIRHERPGIPCGRSNHKQQHEGSGRLDCDATRIGALDKIFDPARMPAPYRGVAQAHFRPIADDGGPLKVVGGKLTKVAPATW
jgi:hypothetical protein